MSELSCSVGFHIDNPGEANSKERVMLQLTSDASIVAHLLSAKSARNLALQLWMMADQVKEDDNE